MTETDETRAHRKLLARLSEAELDVLLLACKGLGVQQTADHRGTKASTVHTIRASVLRKLDVDTLIEAAVIAAKGGMT